MVYNNLLSSSFSCKRGGNCVACQGRYNCLSYAIFLLEKINTNGDQDQQHNYLSEVLSNMQLYNTQQLNSQQEIAKSANNTMQTYNTQQLNSQQEMSQSFYAKLTELETNINQSFEKIQNMIEKFYEYKVNENNNLDGIVSLEKNDVEVIKPNSSEVGLSTVGQKTFKEKKTLFGKTKWVEE